MSRTMLEDEDGYDFEEIMMDVFRNLGYRNVRNPSKSDDMGRDIVMEKENGGGEEITYVAECKHFSDTKVGRPIIQKLDSACRTFETDNEKQGMVITTNKFSEQAKEYAEKVDIRLMNGDDIRELADDAGLNIYNGNVEIISNKSVPFATKKEELQGEILEEFEKIRHFNQDYLDGHKFHLELIPFIEARSEIYSTYKSDSVGIVNKIKDSKKIYERADNNGKHEEKAKKVYKDSKRFITIDESELENKFHQLDFKRFGFSEGEYKENLKENIAKNNKQEIQYTARNNATYNKIHEPDPEDVDVTRFNTVYIPKLKVETEIKEYSYTVEYFTNENQRHKLQNEIRQDVETNEKVKKPSLCPYCGSINKKSKMETERIEDKPICPHCSIKDSYWYKTRYFKDEQNHKEFEEIYSQMNKLQQISENSTGVIITLLALITATIIAITQIRPL